MKNKILIPILLYVKDGKLYFQKYTKTKFIKIKKINKLK
jgi:hypothetical protein